MLVPLLGVSWLVASHDVTLDVDGDAQAVTTHARTVEELLERAGVAYGEHDKLVPDPATPLRDGMVVELVHAREITLLIGDDKDTVLVTALSVDDVLRQIAARQDVSRRASVRPSRLTPVRDGMTVKVINPTAVTVVADGKARDVVTDAPRVAGVLKGLGITLGRHDRVTPDMSTPVAKGMHITVERVTAERQRRAVTIPFATEERTTSDLRAGERREVQSGRDGRARITERVIFVNGVEDSRERLGYRVVRPARTRIVEVGTASPPRRESAPTSRSERPTPQSSPSTAPEPTPRSEPSPSPNPTRERTQTGQASYYHHPDEGMTAAHRSLPFGTVVTVTNLDNGRSVKVTINDRGPYVDGRIIDLNEPAFAEIAAKATGVIDVRITW